MKIAKYSEFIVEFKKHTVTPTTFYLVLRYERAKEGLVKHQFNGLSGISDNDEIIPKFLDVRDLLLVMDGQKVLEKNPSLSKVEYNNPDMLVSNNFKIINRLLQNNDLYIHDVFKKIFQNFLNTKFYQDNYYKRPTYKSEKKNKEIDSKLRICQIGRFFDRKDFYLAEIMEKEINNVRINNVNDFVNWIYNNLKNLEVETDRNVPYGTPPMDVNTITKDDIKFIVLEGLKFLGNVWVHEGEWIVNPNKLNNTKVFNIPYGSKLYFNLRIKDTSNLSDKDKWKNNGLPHDKLPEVQQWIKDNELDKYYEIHFIEGYKNVHNQIKNL